MVPRRSRGRSACGAEPTQNDPEGGIPSGSLEVIGRLENLKIGKSGR